MSHFSGGRAERGPRKECGLRVEGRRCRMWPEGGEKAELLVTWEGGAALIDKYDARCWLTKVELENPSKDTYIEDLSIESLCDDERYLDLIKAQHQTNIEDNTQIIINETLRISPEKEMDNISSEDKVKHSNKEYGAVHFSYEEIKVVDKSNIIEDVTQAENEEDIPYKCPADLIIPENIILPETEKQAAKIEKTATFIANNGTQMEILVKTKQSKNDQFQFLNYDDKLNPFYKFLLEKIKCAEYIPARRHLCHLTKKDENKEYDNPPKSLPKIDISNTSYYKLINKFRLDNPNSTADSQLVEEILDNNIADDIIKTDENSIIDQKSGTKQNSTIEDDIEKLYTALYEQYYTYYYNYYYQLHNSTALLQDSSDMRMEEDSKSMAINAAIYAAKAAVEKYQKEQEEKEQIEKERKEKSKKKKEHCTIIRFIHYVVKYGEVFESSSMLKNDDHLKFLDPESLNHNFYQHCLQRAKILKNKDKIDDKNKAVNDSPSFPKWEDYIKKESLGINCETKLDADSDKSTIIVSIQEQKLMEITKLISNLLNAERIGRKSSLPQIIDVKAIRKRKATEFMEKLKEQDAQSTESEKEKKSKKSKSSSKKRKHRHR